MSHSTSSDIDLSNFEKSFNCNTTETTTTTFHCPDKHKKHDKHEKVEYVDEEFCFLKDKVRELCYKNDVLGQQTMFLYNQNTLLERKTLALEALLALFVKRTERIEKSLGMEIAQLQNQPAPQPPAPVIPQPPQPVLSYRNGNQAQRQNWA